MATSNPGPGVSANANEMQLRSTYDANGKLLQILGPGQTVAFDPANVAMTGGNIAGAVVYAAAYNIAPSFQTYGDSITFGVGASTPVLSYVPTLAVDRGLSVVNNGVSGHQVADCADLVYSTIVGSNQQSTILIGTNDWRVYKNDVNKQAAFASGHLALIAWLATMDANKIKGAAISYSGAWVPLSPYGTLYRSSSVNDAATSTIYGTVAYVGIVIQDGNSSTFNVTIDGVLMGTYFSGPPSGVLINTQINRNYMPNLLRFPGLSEGPHTVVVKTLSVGGLNPYVYITHMAGNLGNASKDGPNVYVGNIPRATASYYPAIAGTSDATVAAYNAIIRNNVNLLASDGLNVCVAEICASLSTLSNISPDGLHPNDSGHAVIKFAFREAMNGIQKPRSLSPNRMPSTSPLVVVTPGASPYSYQNTISSPLQFIIGGGTVSSISLSRNGVAFYTTGLVSGTFTLNPGDYLQVIYSVVPTITAIPL